MNDLKRLSTRLVVCVMALITGACGGPEEGEQLGHAAAALSCPCEITELPPDTGSGPAVLTQELNRYIFVPSNYALGGVVLGGTSLVTLAGAVDVSSGMVMGASSPGAPSAIVNIGALSKIAAVRNTGGIVVGDNTTRVAGSKLESGATVSRGVNVSSADITANMAADQANYPRGFYAKPSVGGVSGVVPEGEEQAIAPGSYGYVRVGGSLRLRSGEYDFSQLNFYDGSRLKLDQANGPIVIHVGRPGMLPAIVDIVTGTGDPNLMLVYAGTETFKVEVPVNMFILATSAPLRFVHAGPHKGSFWGGSLFVDGNATFTKRTLNLATFFPASKIYQGQTLPISIEAEHYSSTRKSDVSSVTYQDNVDSWSPIGSASASGGVAMLHGIDDGHNWTNNVSTRSPRMDFYINFPSTTGAYWIHLRADAPDSNGNSCSVGINDVVYGTSYDFSATPNTWGWLSKQAITVPSVGVHKITVWGREDGLKVDKIVVTTSSTTPTGNGPTESPTTSLL